MQHLRWAGPTDFIAHDVSVSVYGLQLDTIETLHLRPSLRSLLPHNDLEIAVSGTLYGAKLHGQILLGACDDKNSDCLTGEMQIDSLNLDRMQTLQQSLRRRISGQLTLSARMDTSQPAPTVTAQVRIDHGAFALRAPVLGLDQVVFDRLVADLLQTADRLQVLDCRVATDDFDMKAAGDLQLQSAFEQSKLHIHGELSSTNERGKSMPTAAAFPVEMASRYRNFLLSGTLGRPYITFGTIAGNR